MSRFAEGTSVPIDRSKAEIERLLTRYGASGFAAAWESEGDQRRESIMFRYREKTIRFVLPMPRRDDKRFRITPGGQRRTEGQAEAAWMQANRQAWRALALVIKAKLEAIAAGITTFEQEFLAHIVLPGGQTIGQYVLPRLEQVYRTGETKLLESPGPNQEAQP